MYPVDVQGQSQGHNNACDNNLACCNDSVSILIKLERMITFYFLVKGQGHG